MSPRREANLGGLLKKLEGLEKQLGAGDKNENDDGNGNDAFSRVKKQLGGLIMEIKKAITEREELLGSMGKRHVEIAAQSQNIRQLMRDAESAYTNLQTCLAKEEKELAKPKKKTVITQEEFEEHQQIVDLYRKHLDEAIEMDKKRHSRQTRAAARKGAELTEIKRSADDHIDPIEIDSGVRQGLQQLERNDQALDEKLEAIEKGVKRLKNVAQEQNNEVKLQSAMIDKISDNMDHATDHLNEVNTRMKETLARAGGATNIMVKVILLILILSILAYLYKSFA
mmetsp:Transcript_55943/g.114325  ORF Transcript_55943/g.114325 Transcript_55943/m.114325 type:complete len:283 (+) Transcript_55943:252-1100(+)